MSKSSLKQTLKDLDTKKISIRELNQDYLKRIKEKENLNVFIHFSEENVLKQIDKLEKNCLSLLLVDKKLGKIRIRTAIRKIADII